MESTEKLKVIETIHRSETVKVESISERDIKVSGNVTEQNGVITSIDSLCAKDTEGRMLFEGYANPNISGSYYTSGNETEVMEALVEFVNAVRND